VKKAEDVVLFESVPAFEEIELHGEGQAGNFSAQLIDEFHGCFHGSAGGQEVVDEDHALAWLDCVRVNLECVRTVFEIVCDTGYSRGKFAGLADGNKPGVEPIGEGRAEDESAGLDAEDEVDALLEIVSGKGVDHFGEAGLVFKQRGDVVEEDAGLGKVGYGAHEGFELFYVDRLGFGHEEIIKGWPRGLPGAFDLERAQVLCFFFVEMMFEQAVDAAAAGASPEALAKFVEIISGAGSNDFHVAVFRVAHPAAQVEFAGFPVNKPAEAYTLHATLNEEMKNHGDHGQCFRGRTGRATAGALH